MTAWRGMGMALTAVAVSACGQSAAVDRELAGAGAMVTTATTSRRISRKLPLQGGIVRMSTRYTQGTPRTYTTDVIVLVSKRAVVRLIFSNCCEPFPDAAVDRVITSVASRLTFYQQATVPLPAVPGFVEEPDSGTGSGSGSRVV